MSQYHLSKKGKANHEEIEIFRNLSHVCLKYKIALSVSYLWNIFSSLNWDYIWTIEFIDTI